MDYLTNYYRHKCEQLQEHLSILQRQLNEVQDPVGFIFRAAKRYGSKSDYGEHWPIQREGTSIALPKFDEDVADDVTKKYWSVREHIGGGRGYGESITQKLSKETFNISDLSPTQPYVEVNDPNIWDIKTGNYGRQKVIVATHEGKPYIIDGHHSVVGARLIGAKTIDAYHVNLDNYQDIKPQQSQRMNADELRKLLAILASPKSPALTEDIAEIPDSQKPEILRNLSQNRDLGHSFKTLSDELAPQAEPAKEMGMEEGMPSFALHVLTMLSALSDPNHPIHKIPQAKASMLAGLQGLGIPPHLLKFATPDIE